MDIINKQQQKKSSRKVGRNARTNKHYAGQFCDLKGCGELQRSRKFDKALGVYVSR